MKFFNILRERLRALFQRERVIDEIDEEMRLHVELEKHANLSKGMSEFDAQREADRAFGNYASLRDAAYGVRGGGMLETLWQDIRYGARVLVKHKGFTAVAVLTLALGIGANTAIFSVVNELLLRRLPYTDPERIVMVWEVTPSGRHENTTSRANFRTWREQNQSFEDMAAFSDQRLNLTGDGPPEEVPVQFTTPELFQILGSRPLLGRVMNSSDADPRKEKVALLSYGIWQRRFGGDPGIVGKAINLHDSPFNVIGVMPPDFQWHIKRRSGTGKAPEIWTVLSMPSSGPSLVGRFLSVVAKLKQGVSLTQAESDIRAIEARIAQDDPEHNKGYSAEAIPLREQLVGNARPALLILLGAVGFVLLIACANVANLMLARAADREKEIALRTALGAHRLRIIRQLLTESLLLALFGSVFGLGLAWCGIKALIAISPRDVVSFQNVGINLTVLGWTLGISLATGIIFGLAPALEAARINLNEALKEGGKGGGGQSSRSRRIRSAFVVAEVALALVLLSSAGLLMRSFIRLQNIDTGFSTDNILTMVVPLSSTKYKEDPQVISFFRQANERIKALPSVQAVGIVNYLPLYGGLGSATGFKVEGRPPLPPGLDPGTNVRVCDSGYFAAMGIPLLRGRTFSDAENTEAKHVVLINQAMALKHFPGEDPIGKRIDVSMFLKPNPTEIIGIVGDVRYDSLVDQPEPTVYFPHPDLTYEFMTLVIRTSNDPTAIAPAVQRELRAIDSDQPVADVRTMNQVMSQTRSRARFNTLLLGLFAALATLLAAVGIFGVMNYSVSLRTHEIGLRIALGAEPKRVLMLILKQGLLLTVIGIAIGLAGALALTRFISGLLFDVKATDPFTFGVIVVFLGLVSLIACYIPARRATRVDPLVALRYQ
jgi:putative ABC transport system permease protein